MGQRYLRGVDAALRGAALPYGYTITVWASGAALIGARGTPTVGEIYLFAVGAALAYGVLKIASHGRSGGAQLDVAASPRVLRAGVLHVGAIGAGIGAAALIARIDSGASWLAAAFAATAVYLAVTSAEIALVASDPETAGQ